MVEELIIDEKNFHEYFHDIRKYRPEAGQVLARFRAVAVFGYGPHKMDVIKLLQINKAKQAVAVMQNIHLARTPDCYRICREMCEDLLSGMSDEGVARKEHEYVIESMYYVRSEYVPKNDPHWELVQVLEYNEETKDFKAREIHV